MKGMAAPKLTVKELERLLGAEFPHLFNAQGGYAIDAVWHGGCRVRKYFDPQSLRPGGTIAGTTLMTLADFAPYVAILATIGWVPLAVTTNRSINFLRKPQQRDLFAEARLISSANAWRLPKSTSARKGMTNSSPMPPPPIPSRFKGEMIPPCQIIEIPTKYLRPAVDLGQRHG